MRTFIVKMNHPFEAVELNNLTKNRTDLAARCVNSAFWLGHGLRRDVKIYFCFSNGKTLSIDSSIKKMWPDERNIAGYFKKIAEGGKYPGIKLDDRSFEDVLKKFSKEKMHYFEQGGLDFFALHPGEGSVYVFGDDKGLEIPKETRAVSLGPEAYLTSHCITVVNNWLDRMKK